VLRITLWDEIENKLNDKARVIQDNIKAALKTNGESAA
jgi:hypothetical protein